MAAYVREVTEHKRKVDQSARWSTKPPSVAEFKEQGDHTVAEWTEFRIWLEKYADRLKGGGQPRSWPPDQGVRQPSNDQPHQDSPRSKGLDQDEWKQILLLTAGKVTREQIEAHLITVAARDGKPLGRTKPPEQNVVTDDSDIDESKKSQIEIAMIAEAFANKHWPPRRWITKYGGLIEYAGRPSTELREIYDTKVAELYSRTSKLTDTTNDLNWSARSTINHSDHKWKHGADGISIKKGVG